MTTRRGFLRGGAAAAAATLGIQPAAASGAYSPLVDDARGLVLFRPGDAAATYRGGSHYGWHVRYDASERSLLDDWIESRDVDVLSDPKDGDETGVIAISAPIRDVAPGALDMGSSGALATRGYVESIDLVQTVDQVAPVTPQTKDAVDTGVSAATKARMAYRSGNASDLDDGLAYTEDMPAVDIDTVRSQTNAVSSTFGGALPDTSSLTVAVIDTGVNDGAVFEDGTGSSRILSASKNVITGETGVAAVEDGNSHGTWCASAIAGSHSTDALTGYAPKADILAVKALNDDGSGSTDRIVEALRYAADQGVDAICMSLGSPLWSDALDRAVSYAVGAGAAVFIAAGNDRFQGDGWVNSPADSPDAFAVAATTGEPADEQKVAYFSSRGPDPGTTNASAGVTSGATPDLGAPGCRITVQAPGYGEIERSGTSMATPCTTGAALQLMADDSSLQGDPEALYKRFEYAATTKFAGVTDVGEHGVLDVEAARTETEPDTTQTDVRNSQAEDRDRAHRSLNDLEGGWLTGL